MVWDKLHPDTRAAIEAAMHTCETESETAAAAVRLSEVLKVDSHEVERAIERCCLTVPAPRDPEAFAICLFGRLGL